MNTKVFLVTGATSGIGRATCLALLNKGINIIGIGRNGGNVLDIKEKFKNFFFRTVDLAEIDSLDNIIKELVDVFGKFDGLIHCAGLEETLPLSQYSHSRVKEIFHINVFVTIELLKLISKKKYSNDQASIILFSSVMGNLGQAGKVGYCGTKSAVLGIVRSSALELAKRKFRVNAISPGVVQTPMTEKLFASLTEEQVNQIINMHPLGIGEVEDVVPLIEFLISNGSLWVTGQNFIVDGGYSCQ